MNQWTSQTPTQPGWYWYTVLRSHDGAIYLAPTIVEIVAYVDNGRELQVRKEDGTRTMRHHDIDDFVRDHRYETLLWQAVVVPAPAVIGVDWQPVELPVYTAQYTKAKGGAA